MYIKNRHIHIDTDIYTDVHELGVNNSTKKIHENKNKTPKNSGNVIGKTQNSPSASSL